MQKHEQVIYKRAAHRHEEEHHGGAWKVAFADFMIALMALFLVLWIVQAVDKDDRKEIATQMAVMSVFDTAMASMFDTSPSNSPIDFESDSAAISSNQSMLTAASFYQGDRDGLESDSLIDGTFDTQERLEVLAKVVKKMVNQTNAEGNVDVIVTPQGLRIVLQDNSQESMFQRGGSNITPYFEDILFALAPIFQRVDNPVIISGHTDGTRYLNNQGRLSNWELSASRANSARQTLIASGMPDQRVLQVTGMSDRSLLNPQDPLASENRRVELFILTTAVANTINTLFGSEEGNELQKARQKAEFNRPVSRQEANHYPVQAEISEMSEMSE